MYIHGCEYKDIPLHIHVHVCIVQSLIYCVRVPMHVLCVCSTIKLVLFWCFKYRQVLRNTLTKMFADLEVKKKKLEERDQAER